MLKTNSEVVKKKIRAFITKEATPGASDNGETIPDYLRRIYTEAAERVKGTKEKPLENIVNSALVSFMVISKFSKLCKVGRKATTSRRKQT